MRPCDAKKHADLLKLDRDNFPAENDVWSILVSGESVSLHAPHSGSYVSIPSKEFRSIVDWYMADQPEQKKAKRKKVEG
jgi:hypothetical protein